MLFEYIFATKLFTNASIKITLSLHISYLIPNYLELDNCDDRRGKLNLVIRTLSTDLHSFSVPLNVYFTIVNANI